MDNEPVNAKLYERVKNEAKEKFKRYPSLYSSAWIVKTYKQRGGTYRGGKSNSKGVARWYREQWVMVIPFVKSGKVVECGSDMKDTKSCRPLRRITKDTPITLPELMRLHSKTRILEMARKKNKQMHRRVNWETLEFY